jgi:hypothetical protein
VDVVSVFGSVSGREIAVVDPLVAVGGPQNSRRVHITRRSGRRVARAGGRSASPCVCPGLGAVSDRDAAFDGLLTGGVNDGISDWLSWRSGAGTAEPVMSTTGRAPLSAQPPTHLHGTHRIRKRWPLLGLVLVALIALVGAGCGSNTATGSASHAGGGASSAGASKTADTQATRREKAVKFAECVRVHGVPHFPDPDATSNFNFAVDVTAATFTAAVNACKSLQPPGTLSAHRSAKQQSAALRFAACVRAHGVPDFPDPVNGQPLIDTDHIPSSNTPSGMNILNAATHTCGSILGPDARTGGGGSGG